MDIKSDENSDKKSILSSKSAKSSSSRKSVKPRDLESDDISLSQLELMANKKKMNKADEISLVSNKSSYKDESIRRSDPSISSSTLNDTERYKRREKTIARENKNDQIRREKSEFLYKFNKLNVKGKWSSLRLDMNNSLDEIRNEYERVRNEIQNERSVAFFKRMLLLGVQGIEMMNNKFDPLGVDLDGWSEAMGYSMENQEYDEVMSELYEKYKGHGQMSPELRLIFMIISSATMFTISKKITKMESNDTFKSLLGGLMGNNGFQQPQQAQQQPQQSQQPPLTQFQQQSQFQQQQFQQPQQSTFYNHRQFSIPNSSAVKVPNVFDLRTSRNKMDGSDTSDDLMPSKMNGPNTNYINRDGVDIDNILKTMNERKREKERQEATEPSDNIKSIPANKRGKGRGRPKKANVSLNF
jgi:hypothetical protein